MAIDPNTTAVTFTPTEVEARQAEVDSYNKNIAIYTQILATLNGEWDADLAQYKDVDAHVAAKACPLDKIARLAELQQYDHISGLLRTEILERTKSQAILNAMTA